MTTPHDDPNDDLTPALKQQLAALAREAAPPAGLEEEVTSTLKAHGEIRRGDRRGWYGMTLATVAAAVVVFSAGLAVGLKTAKPGAAMAPADTTPQWILLLYEDAGYESAPAGAEAGRVREYGAWAGTLAQRGALVAGEKLDDAGTLLLGGDSIGVSAGHPGTREGTLSGYFTIRAGTRDEAIAIARECPHLKYRGRISLRRIDPT